MSVFITKIQSGAVYQATLAGLAILSVLLLAYEFFGQPTESELNIIWNFDMTTAMIYLADFFTGLLMSSKKFKYFKQNWLNLLSSIPLNNTTFRLLRVLRIVRAVRVIRAASAIVGLGQVAHSFSKVRKRS